MTTWAATGYIPRLIEAAALADVLVYAASDERYNDEMPTQFLSLLVHTGKPVIVCLMKMRKPTPTRWSLISRRSCVSPARRCGKHPAIPYLPPAELADPARSASKYRIPLLNQVSVLGSPPAAGRRRSVVGAINYLVRNLDSLLAAAKNDVAALQRWQQVVEEGRGNSRAGIFVSISPARSSAASTRRWCGCSSSLSSPASARYSPQQCS